ncbi:hypothetical protein [Thiohalomonas denitrificans]|nr:hypothetical protein [Thiohalomonas denitrificans]
MDAVAFGSILAVVVSLVIPIVLVIRVLKLINRTHSEDEGQKQ